jgi:putative toxin-antitoxin system antitoxin component (TIGR02293 family)
MSEINAAEFLARATIVFGGEERARAWLHEPAMALDGQRPADLLQSPEGAEVVRDFLLRLEYCVYS